MPSGIKSDFKVFVLLTHIRHLWKAFFQVIIKMYLLKNCFLENPKAILNIAILRETFHNQELSHNSDK